jgi:hypothetical protein
LFILSIVFCCKASYHKKFYVKIKEKNIYYNFMPILTIEQFHIGWPDTAFARLIYTVKSKSYHIFMPCQWVLVNHLKELKKNSLKLRKMNFNWKILSSSHINRFQCEFVDGTKGASGQPSSVWRCILIKKKCNICRQSSGLSS